MQWTRLLAKHTLLLLASLVVACWADFPEDRLNQDIGTAPDAPKRDSQHSPGPDLGQNSDGEADLAPAVDGSLDSAVGPDSAPDQLVPDTQVCAPDTFVSCTSASELQKCNAQGDGFVTVDCSPAACSTSLGRCDQCDPATFSPSCSGSDLTLCTADGLQQTQTCALGCKGGTCCTDSDGDKVSSCSGDCNDNDANVKPSQQAFFTQASDGSFDYNCDKQEEQELTVVANCQTDGAGCKGDGWQGSVPACGAQGNYVTCERKGSNCKPSPKPKIQACR